jgi:PAS domain S-box-containing protein
MLDPSGRVPSWNEGAQRIMGYSAEAAIGRYVEMFYAPEDVAEGRPKCELALAAERGQLRSQVWQVRKDGSRFLADVVTTAIRDEQTGLLRGFGRMTCDRTVQKQALDEQQQREALLFLLIERAPAALAMFDREMRYLAYSQRWLADFGLGERSLRGISYYEVFPEIPQRWKDIHARCLAGEVLRSDGDSFLRADGRTEWMRWEIQPWRTAAGTVGGIIIFSELTTEQRRTQAELARLLVAEQALRVEAQAANAAKDRYVGELRDSEERQRLAVEAAHIGMWLRDLNTGRVVQSPLAAKLIGVRGLEINVDEFFEAVHPDDRDRVRSAVARALSERTDYRAQFRVVWPDGSEHWISALGCASYDGAGRPIRLTGVSIDITAQRRAEDERAQLLERERAARAEAEAATVAKDEFLAVLSHELRTPLQSMLGWTQILRNRNLDEQTFRKGIDTIERNVRAQTKLIEDLLDVSRIVAGKLLLEHRPTDLATVIEAALESVRSSALSKKIRIEVNIEPSQTVVMGDADRLQQIVCNLLSNAVKFTPAGMGVAVRLERVGPLARISVRDEGCGISAEFLPQVFERFRQANVSRRGSHGGLGLGLAIVRHLAELHGGTVKAESDGEGRGATFTVVLPVVSTQRALLAKGETGPRVGTAPTLEGLQILVVDDDPDACELLETTFEEKGASVRSVQSVRAAKEALESFPPHLLLTDVGMPDQDGYALIKWVRDKERTQGRHVPAVALTAFASQADREHALAEGFDAHVAKPADPVDLARTVARLAGRYAP